MATTPPLEDIVLYQDPLGDCCREYSKRIAAENARHTAALGALRKKLTDSPEYKGEQTRWAAEQKVCSDRLTGGDRAFSYVNCMAAANREHAARGAAIEAAVYTPFYDAECAAHQERTNYIEYARYGCCQSDAFRAYKACCQGDDGKPIRNPM